jgi:hypothetical protein
MPSAYGRSMNVQYYKYHPWYLPRWGQLKLFKFIPDKFVLLAKLVPHSVRNDGAGLTDDASAF